MIAEDYAKITEIANKVSNTMYIGIDPGKNGGISFMYRGKVDAYKCPTTPELMAKLFEDIISNKNKKFIHEYRMCRIVLEKEHSFPGQWVLSMFSFSLAFFRIGKA